MQSAEITSVRIGQWKVITDAESNMDYSAVIEAGTGQKTGRISSDRAAMANEKKEKGLSSVKKGQLITGTVIAAEDQVTLNFDGQKVTASKSVLSDAVPGEKKTFEVVKATDSEIELKLIDGNSRKRHTFKAVMVKDADWDGLLAQKGQASKKAAEEARFREIADKLEEIGAKLTEQDCRLLEEEGFPAETFTVKGLYEAVNRMKAAAAPQERRSPDKAAGGPVSFDENTLAKVLKEENLPVTPDNLAKISKALGLSETVTKMDDKAMRYLISRDMQPTIENIYKAYYSGTKQEQKLSEDAWRELEGQVKEIIKAAGYEVNGENLKAAKWLIESKLPLTAETFAYKKELEGIKNSFSKASALDKILEGMKNGISPRDVSLLEPKDASGERIIADIRSIEPEAITEAVKSGTELTIKNLVTIQEKLGVGSNSGMAQISGTELPHEELPDAKLHDAELSDVKLHDAKLTDTEQPNTEQNDIKLADTESDTRQPDTGKEGSGNRNADAGAHNPDSRYEEIRARRQLEEIRLKMTLEAANLLEKKGFKLETEELSKVVDALRELEDSYYKGLFREADVEAADSSLQILKETAQSIEKLKFMPSYLLGSTLSERSVQTIPGLLSEGSRLQAELARAGTAYETLMTVPNREYGDSIQKAFANVTSLLSELGLEATGQNQRAARILGYNQMEINEENLERVKAYDLQVTSLIQNLHPAVTVRMIKEGYNPLELPVDELNRTIDRIKEEQGITSEDKYSTYLRKLEQEDGITGEERKAYIGIYRLLYNIEKSDGAALGAVIKAEREVTLDSLLTAVQTGKKGRLDAAVDDEFGTLQSISREKESIAEQLDYFTGGAGRQNGAQTDVQASKGDKLEEQIRYLDQVLKQMKEEISPEKLKELEKNLNRSDQSLNQSDQSLNQSGQSLNRGGAGARINGTSVSQSSHKGIWETIKNIPIEKLSGQLQDAEGTQGPEDRVFAEKVREIRELCKNSEQSIRFLNDYQVPSTPMNIMIANQILSNGESPIKRFFQLKKENIVEKSENSLKEMNELSDTLIDKHSMEEAYNQMETDAKETLQRSYSEERIDSRRLAELKSLGQQMTFARKLAEKEYYQIPIETGRGITNMNLTILRGTEDSGKVSVTVRSEQLGNIKAEFTLKDRMLKGFISSDSRGGLEQLQKNAGELETAAAESSVTLKQLNFVVQHRDNDTYSYRNSSLEEGGTSRNTETERTLYRVAKAIIRTVRSAEDEGSDLNRTVSQN
jgi:hypothetical protein